MFQIAATLGYAYRYGGHAASFDLSSQGEYANTIFHRLPIGRIPEDSIEIWDPGDFSFREIPFHEGRDVVIRGHLQSERYFEHCRQAIASMLGPSHEEERRLSDKYRECLSGTALSVHVRRGDYLHKQECHPLLSVGHYRTALETVRSRTPVDRVLCFSDDIPWCRDAVDLDVPTTYIEGERADTDMFLMSMCRHNVIANSTFSWWAAWLNPNPSKIVIAPQRHFGPAFGHLSDRDIYPEGWLRLDDPTELERSSR